MGVNNLKVSIFKEIGTHLFRYAHKKNINIYNTSVKGSLIIARHIFDVIREL